MPTRPGLHRCCTPVRAPSTHLHVKLLDVLGLGVLDADEPGGWLQARSGGWQGERWGGPSKWGKQKGLLMG